MSSNRQTRPAIQLSQRDGFERGESVATETAATKIQEENMSSKHSRLGVWGLALVTCLAFGGQSAFAWNNQPRVHAAGSFFHNDPNNLAGGFSDKVQFGVNGRCNNDGFSVDPVSGAQTCNNTRQNLGEFDYHNQFTKVNAHGKIQVLTFQKDSDCAAILYDSTLAGKPEATIKGGGQCPVGGCPDPNGGLPHQYNFEITVVDADDTAPQGKDAVCKVFVNGMNNMHLPAAESDSGNYLTKGDVEIKPDGRH